MTPKWPFVVSCDVNLFTYLYALYSSRERRRPKVKYIHIYPNIRGHVRTSDSYKLRCQVR